MGSVETSCIPALAPENALDWDYFDFHPDSGIIMEDAGEGLAELVIKPLGGDLWLQPVFSIFPGISEWRTSDLFEQHPDRPGLWRFRHRQDDVLVLNNGEKYDPIMFEKTVENHPLVKGALVVGHGKIQPGLIIEPDWTLVQDDNPRSLLQQLWPVVEEANSPDATQARIRKGMILFASREKPFCRTAKHSIAKHATLELYTPEIEALYSADRVDEELSAQLGAVGKNPGRVEIRDLVRRALKLLLGNLPDGYSDDDEIFTLAVDSVLVLSFARALRHALQETSVALGSADVYANPTINTLSTVIHNKINGANEALETQQIPREQVMAQLVEEYTANLPQANHNPLPPPDCHTVILTGSTGSLGSYILETLLESPNIAKVYCLNRSEQAEERQKKTFASRGTRSDLSRATFLHADLSQPRFNLPEPTYDTLTATATLFIHAAWAVDFNHPLTSFAPTHLAGIHHAAAFALRSAHRCRLAFISSIAAVARHPSPAPESLVPFTAAARQGYAESKLVAERILAAAGAPVTILRCGQLAGPRAGCGAWARQEWLPSLVVSAAAMGLVPARLGAADALEWLPVDTAARAVVECALSAVGAGVDVLHVAAPRATSWSALLPVVREHCRRVRGGEVEVVGYDEWVEALKDVALTAEEVRLKPSVKMVEFYESMKVSFPALSTARAVACSKSLRESGPVDAALFEKWLKQWA
ncbi:AMP-dependent synthetase/ligase [Neofusicoccum parvum]|uniref:AMP-dependent synthetase/ligase n=1 Tax=Neofusicoccum parvum TaxID=310453 RepID=A0ACB5SQ97_9PEZI|nr:AMP-dependent synthetase/ligase [Neofusicoccum parvum]